MNLFRGLLARPKRRERGNELRPLVVIPPIVMVLAFLWRRWIFSSLMAVVLVTGLGCFVWWAPWQKCGRGMTATGSPAVCVGLDLDSTALSDTDPLADLEKTIANNNRATSGPFATIVVLDDITPDPRNDSVALRAQRHIIEGAITAVSRANDPKTGGIPKIKLLLANFGFEAGAWHQAVDAIKQARLSEHIVAVTGIGQSRDTSRAAVASLSDAGIVVIGTNVTADNMSLAPGPEGKRSTNFVRVVPTNTQEAIAASKYIKQHSYHKVLLVQDVNEADGYAQTLAHAFETNDNVTVNNKERYRSPEAPLQVANREQLMANIFTRMRNDICTIQPDLIYFAGRGTDLGYFLTALSSSGACEIGSLDVMTGDDTSNLVGGRISTGGDFNFKVFYTALAHTDQWNSFPSTSEYIKNYLDFVATFNQENFKDANLDDGNAMLSYDAVDVAIAATKSDAVAISDPDTVADFLVSIRCKQYVPGASGPIALGQDGNPIDKAMPILQLHLDGTVTQQDLAWPTGQPLDPNSTC
ncbi:MAG: ABC transporter substrate-binding protein [Pseudonocardiaceae bacterium]